MFWKFFSCWWKTLILPNTPDGQSPLLDVTIQEMYSFLAISVQMRHDQKDPMKAYWSTVEQFSVCPFTER